MKATFFCTSNFAENASEVMRRIMDEGHEVAAHGCDHWQPQASDVSRSKEILERLTGRTIEGYRQPRMFPVSDTELERMGYVYNSSLNPRIYPRKIYAFIRAAYLLYDRQTTSNPGFCNSMDSFPAILVVLS